MKYQDGSSEFESHRPEHFHELLDGDLRSEGQVHVADGDAEGFSGMGDDARHIDALQFAMNACGFHSQDDLKITRFKHRRRERALRVVAKADRRRNVVGKWQHAQILPVQ